MHRTLPEHDAADFGRAVLFVVRDTVELSRISPHLSVACSSVVHPAVSS